VRQGYVSVKAAAEKYGVVIDPETFAIDQAATEKLRASQS
jgi:N-methylhydantoinase B